jgi:hypothetical protein
VLEVFSLPDLLRKTGILPKSRSISPVSFESALKVQVLEEAPPSVIYPDLACGLQLI